MLEKDDNMTETGELIYYSNKFGDIHDTCDDVHVFCFFLLSLRYNTNAKPT